MKKLDENDVDIIGISPLIVNSVYDNLVYDGGFEKWTGGILDQWLLSAVNAPTVTQCGDALGDTTKKTGAFCAKLNRAGGGDGYIYQALPNYKEYAGKIVSFSCYVKTDTAARVRLSINDGSANAGAAHTGGGGWELLTVSNITISATPTKLELRIDCINGAADIYIDEAMATPCSAAPTFVPPGAAYRQTTSSGVASINITGGTALTGAVLFTNAAADVAMTQDVGNNKMLVGFTGTSGFLTATTGYVSNIANVGSAGITGGITFSAGANIAITQTTSGFTFAATNILTSTVNYLSGIGNIGSAQVTGAAYFSNGTGITITETSNVFTFARTGSGVDTIGQSGGTNWTGNVLVTNGAGISFADVPLINGFSIANNGLLSIANMGSTGITGDMRVSAGANMTITQASNTLTFAAAAGGTPARIQNATNDTYIDVTNSAQTIEMYAKNNIAFSANIVNTRIYGVGVDGIIVSANGEITMNNQSTINVYSETNQVLTAGQATNVAFRVIGHDVRSEWNGSNTFTAAQSGKYKVTCQLYLSGMSSLAAAQHNARIYHNSNLVQVNYENNFVGYANCNLKLSKTLNIATNDTIVIQVAQNGTNNTAYVGGAIYNTFLCIDKVA